VLYAELHWQGLSSKREKFDENGMAVATIATVTGRLHALVD